MQFRITQKRSVHYVVQLAIETLQNYCQRLQI